MSAGVMILVGLMLAMAGIWSVPLVLVCAGAGAALVLGGLSRVDADIPGFPSDPQGHGEQGFALAMWVALAVLGRFVQRRGIRSPAAETS